MYVYRTNSFNNELKKYQNLSLRVANLCSKLESDTVFEAQKKFERIHSYLKRKEGNFRLIAKAIEIEKELIICFLKVYVRGEPGYRHFLEIVKHQNYLFKEAKLKPKLLNWVKTLRNSQTLTINNTLEDDLRIWLQPPNWRINTKEIIIHESELWSRQFTRSQIRDSASVYRQIIEELVAQLENNNDNTALSQTKWEHIYYYGKNNFYIIYSQIKTKDEPQEQVLFLIAPILGIPDEAIIHKLIAPLVSANTESSWWQKRHNVLLDDLITYTKRSYPWYLISDEDFWLRIQDGDGVNLALSTEEKELLNDVSTKDSLPLFLNGRAGSGKSTMLFYLFAYYCHRHLQFCRKNKQNFLNKPHPLFITYSQDLSGFAKGKVQSLLNHHHHFLEETGDLENIPDLTAFFQSFRPFLLRLLPSSEKNKFQEENYVSFHRFRELFSDRHKKFSPEKCWLVIQNFIKGYELITKDVYLETKEKYQQIPKKQRTVTIEEFIEIRDTVWYWYHKHTQNFNLWDDRDLVRTILDSGYYKPEYTVIFCDEAQDFTRLELQLIMKLSVFSVYNLERETIFSIPFAFAGDPLQTLNPTGFRWDSFKAAFYDKVLTPLKLVENSKIELRLKQLKYNYRSAAAIVKVNNLIQLWRKVLFDFTEIEPQKAKKYNNFIPQKFIIGDNITLNHLQKTLTNTIILIPCDEGAEKEFIARDEWLSSFSQNTNIETPWNILSAISAKGLEFKQVILYRFGEACNNDLFKDLDFKIEEDKYFLNKLYVAASRATEKLFIIDSFDGEIRLWSYASRREFVDRFLDKIENTEERQQWQENIDLITSGSSLVDLNNNNLEADALTFETVGINTQNPNLLNRAISAYQKSQNSEKVNFCLAWKLRIERKYLAAGDLFARLYKIKESCYCFWHALAWERLQKLITNTESSDITQFKILAPAIAFMVQNATIESSNVERLPIPNILEVTDFLNTELQQNNLLEERDSKPWQVFFTAYYHQIQSVLNSANLLAQDDWLLIANVLINYLAETAIECNRVIATCFYFGRDYRLAIKYWEDINYDSLNITHRESKYYYLAQAKLAKLPQGLKYLYQGQQYSLIIKQWLKTGATLESAWLEYVALSFDAMAQYDYALKIHCCLNKTDKVQQYWQEKIQENIGFKQIKQIISYYLKQQLWDELINFASQKLDLLNFQCYFIYRLAYSSLNTQKITKSQRQKYQQFIEQHLVPNERWQQYLTIEHLGITLEKIGSFVSTLTFYERYVNSNNRQLQTFARDRWIATKKRQIDYFKEKVNLDKIQKSQKQLTAHAVEWHLDPQRISCHIPINPANSSLSYVKQELTTPSFTITGLPHNTQTKILRNNIQQIQFKHLLLRIARVTQQLAIVNLLNRQTIFIDWRKGKIQQESTTILASGNQPMYFSEAQGKYQGIIWREKNPRLELKLDDYPTIITIKFSHL